MSDMFDVYWQQRAIAGERSARRNAAHAQQIINNTAAERNTARRQRDEARRQRDEARRQRDEARHERDRAKRTGQVFHAHYVALHARAEFLLEQLDEAYGGPQHNPARMIASEDVTVPRGPREGELIQLHDRVYFAALNSIIKEENYHDLGDGWRDVVKRWGIFGSGENWKEGVKSTLEAFAPHLKAAAERSDKTEQAEQAILSPPPSLQDQSDQDKRGSETDRTTSSELAEEKNLPRDAE
jgi:hypothetical protein